MTMNATNQTMQSFREEASNNPAIDKQRSDKAVSSERVPQARHQIAVALYDGVVPTDAFLPCDTFSRVILSNGDHPYQVKLCADSPVIRHPFGTLAAPHTVEDLIQANTVILPGLHDPLAPLPEALLSAVRQAAQRGARIASICTGAFVLAATGLLDGRRATTHWHYAGLLREKYPTITVDPDVLYIDHGQLLTSAGALAGVDLCLHLIRSDVGAQAAAHCARMSVMPLERSGGQKQFIPTPPVADSAYSLQPLLQWAEAHLAEAISVTELARRSAVSPRTLHRRFLEQLGMPPTTWLLQRRIHLARQLLESTQRSIEQVAGESGLGSAANLRKKFLQMVGTSPSAYRKAFRSPAPEMQAQGQAEP
ncbi:GlxA family transcriptional regulator [Photobacterium atrarenae]|uniref:Helix-turn-helix domain-containing protein n=1 Tax=Photobacterium atrarenae TaxID=865757 RepID=A0ABY5GKM5_9GAMM|nr:helix-turn-helix domain-containing protein [Photobacterium atrarenae]UTV29463.1 helix-turn-helix domain-containing protein [Photobacterium atrarenae]